jgi:O-antigen/teichoic acid export membrane protein
MSEDRGVRRAVYLVTGSSLLVPLVGIVTAPILAQALGVAGRGSSPRAMAPNSLVVSVATLGLPEALTFSLARQPSLTRRPLVFSSIVGTVLGALCLAVAALSASVLSGGDDGLAGLLLVERRWPFPLSS